MGIPYGQNKHIRTYYRVDILHAANYWRRVAQHDTKDEAAEDVTYRLSKHTRTGNASHRVVRVTEEEVMIELGAGEVIDK